MEQSRTFPKACWSSCVQYSEIICLIFYFYVLPLSSSCSLQLYKSSRYAESFQKLLWEHWLKKTLHPCLIGAMFFFDGLVCFWLQTIAFGVQRAVNGSNYVWKLYIIFWAILFYRPLEILHVLWWSETFILWSSLPVLLALLRAVCCSHIYLKNISEISHFCTCMGHCAHSIMFVVGDRQFSLCVVWFLTV